MLFNYNQTVALQDNAAVREEESDSTQLPLV
jgi:hypothetical protein